MPDFKRQPLNIRPYSKTGTVLFIVLHLIAVGCHTVSFLIGMAYLPKDILVYPLAELTTTQTEIVGPCLGQGSNSNNCDRDQMSNTGAVLYPLSLGTTTSQPRCTSTEIAGGTSCGVDTRQEAITFTLNAFDSSKRQEFNEINIMGLFVYVDLISIIFHGYAAVVVYTSAFEDPLSAIIGLFGLCKKKGSQSKASRLEDFNDSMRHTPHYPRSPEYNRRWIDIALTYSLLTLAVSISVGITDFFHLIFMILGVQVIALLGFLVDDFRYQLRITDADAYNKNQLFNLLVKSQSGDKTLAQFKRMQPFNSGWTQPARNIVFCVGLQVIVWYFIQLSIQEAADNIIISLDSTNDQALGTDAFQTLATIFRWLTGIIGFWQGLVIIGDMIAGDRTVAHKNPPGNFLLNQLDGDACFVILMFITKIVVSWIAVSTVTEVYNFAGGKEMRNGVLSDTYLDNDLDAPTVRIIMLVCGTCALAILTSLNWFLTPSSSLYYLVGVKIERGCCNKCLPKEEQEVTSVGAPVKSKFKQFGGNNISF